MSLKKRIIEHFEKYDPINEDYEKIRNLMLFFDLLSLVCLMISAVTIYFGKVELSIMALVAYAVFDKQAQMWKLAEVRKAIWVNRRGD